MNHQQILKECYFKTSRSSGAGGQHVNKVETKVILHFNIKNSEALSQDEKEILLIKLKNRIDKSGVLKINSQKSRSQLTNKKAAEKKLLHLLDLSLKRNKKRIPVKISKSAIEKRLKNKKRRSEIKRNRTKNFRNFN